MSDRRTTAGYEPHPSGPHSLVPCNPELTALQRRVCFEGATEQPFSGEFDAHFTVGRYHCVNCTAPLFESTHKFDAGCGWPSFDHGSNISRCHDTRAGMIRVEIRCQQCGSHLGHVFTDGPTATGERFCVNSAALKFAPDRSKFKL